MNRGVVSPKINDSQYYQMISQTKSNTIPMSAIDLNQNLVGLTNQSLNYIKYEQNRNFVNCEQGVGGCYPNNGNSGK